MAGGTRKCENDFSSNAQQLFNLRPGRGEGLGQASRASCRRPGPCRTGRRQLPPTNAAAPRTQATASRPRSTRSRLNPATNITLPSSCRAPSMTAIGAALRRNWSISCRKTCGPPETSATTTLIPPNFVAPASSPSTPTPSDFAPAAESFFACRNSLAIASTRSGTSSGVTRRAAAVRASAALHAAKMLQRRPAGQGRDPPRAGRHALLADDLQQADLRGVVQVRAAAKLLAEIADGNHPHHVGILLAEEHHRPRLPGLGQRHRRRADRLALENLFIDLGLDPGQLFGADGRRIGEVETQQVVVHLRALLQGVLAQVRAEGVVEQMRGRMGAADARRGAADRPGR